MLKRSLLRVLPAAGVIVVSVALCVAYARFVEPRWLCVRHFTLSSSPTIRVIHISDIHFTGDTQYLERVTQTINGMNADLVCFTGDLIEDAAFLKGALHILSKVNKPMYGVPGNHDYRALRSFDDVRKAFRETGGDWLTDKPVLVPSKQCVLLPLPALDEQMPAGYKRILLDHYPDAVGKIHGERFDLILAGHTHGGQVRVPFVHRCVLPFDLDTLDKGLFQTPCGPLYVNPGIGTFYLKMRFRCRPEITLIEI